MNNCMFEIIGYQRLDGDDDDEILQKLPLSLTLRFPEDLSSWVVLSD